MNAFSLNVPLDEEQRELLKLTRRLLEEHAGEDHLRRRMNLDAAHDPDLWRRLADLGLISLVLAERWGGAGLGDHVLAPVLHLLGEFAVPEPFLETVVAALLIQEACPEDFAATWLPRIASGNAAVALSFGPRTPVVPYAASADLLLICGGGVTAIETAPNVPEAKTAPNVPEAKAVPHDPEVEAVPHGPGGAGSGPEGSEGWVGGRSTPTNGEAELVVERQDAVDPLYPLYRVTGTGQQVSLDAPAVERAWTRMVAGSACLLTGVSARLLDMTVAYVKTRHQFDRPVGSFQAVKHKLADVATGVDLSQAASFAAFRDTGAPDAQVRAAVAKAYAGEAARQADVEALQLHGGIGFTLEYGLQFWLKRAIALSAAYGTAREHRRSLAVRLLAREAAR